MMEKITLIIGGIHSGKSHFGEELALGYERRPVCLLATEHPQDDFKAHIRMRQRRHGDQFDFRAEQHDLRPLLAKCAGRTVLIDSLTHHLRQRLLEGMDKLSHEQIWENDRGYLNELLSIQKEKGINLIMVSDELGYADSAERRIQALLGLWNQHLARLSHQVVRLSAGIPQTIKCQPAARFRLGAPSRVLPGDLTHNLFYLRQHVDDIQLLVTNETVFHPETLHMMQVLKEGQDLSYSVHMAMSVPIYENSDLVMEQSARFIDVLDSLRPITYTFHFDIPSDYMVGQENTGLSEAYILFFSKMKSRFPGISFSLENTETPLPDLDPVIDAAAITYAIDIGHLQNKGYSLGDIRERLSQASAVHLHHPLPRFAPYFSLISDYSGLVTIENNHPNHLEESLRAIRSYF